MFINLYCAEKLHKGHAGALPAVNRARLNRLIKDLDSQGLELNTRAVNWKRPKTELATCELIGTTCHCVHIPTRQKEKKT